APAAATAYAQPEPPRQRGGKGAPTGGWPYVEQPAEPAKKSRRGVTIGVIIVAILVVVGVGGYVGLKLAAKGNQVTVGACVKQDGAKATVVDCSTAGAFVITKVVDGDGQCPDPGQPSVTLTDQDNKTTSVACLRPAP